jgi:hypothetical protein
MARALTKPVITERDTNFISKPRRKAPATIWITPMRTVAANRYCSPWSRTRVIMRTAVEAVAAEIMAGRPPTTAVTHAIEKDA